MDERELELKKSADKEPEPKKSEDKESESKETADKESKPKKLLHKEWFDKIYMLYENELWLDEQAANGLILKKFDDEFVYFTEAAPENYCYRIMILDEKKAQSQIRTIEGQGFTYEGSYDEYHVFRIDAKYRHIVPFLNGDTIEFAKDKFNNKILARFAGTAIYLVFLVVQIWINKDHLVQLLVETPAMWYVFFILMFLYLAVGSLSEYRKILGAKRYYLYREEYSPNRLTKKSAGMRIFMTIICIIGVYVLIRYTYFEKEQHLSIAEVQKVMPVFLIEEFGEKESQTEITGNSENVMDNKNFAVIKRSLLSPQHYQTRQSSDDTSMNIRYYELAFDVLAEPLARELPNGSVISIMKERPDKVDIEGLDAAYTWQRNDFVVVSACRGNRVMFVFSVGDIGAEEMLKEVAELL